MKTDCLLGIDLGSTSIKAVIFDTAGRVVAEGSRPTRHSSPNADHPEWIVWDADRLWQDTAAAVRDAVTALGGNGVIRGLAVAGFGGDGVPLDEDGRCLAAAISWHDQRVESQSRWWGENIGAERQFSITGSHVYLYNTALRLRWMMEHEPEILERTHKWLLLVDYLNYRLTGRMATDYSLASTTLLLDQKSLTWSDEILQLSEIERRLLPDLRPAGAALGAVTAAASAITGLPEGTPVCQGGHDFLCGALPAGAFVPGVLLDVTGTWELVVTTTPAPPLTGEVFRSGLMIETHVAAGRYAVTGAAVASGMLEWFRTELGQPEKARAGSEDAQWAHLIRLAESSPPGAHGVLFLPHMSGSVCPVRDPRSLGVFAGLSSITQRRDLLRAQFEGLNYQFREMLEAMKSGVGGDFRIVAVGGATRNAFWMQNKADVTGCPIEVPDLHEATALGAAMLAGISAGLYRDEADAHASLRAPVRVFSPNTNLSAQYDHWYRTYQQLYPATRSISSALYDVRTGSTRPASSAGK